MDKKKILSSLALAGILTAGVIGANVNATTANEYLQPVGVYKKLVEGKTVVPYVLKDKNTPVTVRDIKSKFTNLESVNGKAVTDLNLKMKTGDTFRANDIDYTLIVYGDVNKDGKISTIDATIVQKVVTKKGKIDSIQTEAADVNNNGKITTMDALAIQKYVINKQTDVIDILPKTEDTTAPVLNGVKDGDKKIINLNDTTFKLPEVTATDDFDGKVEVTKEGTVDVTKIGEYTITYKATDKAGNTVKATLTIIVDNAKPVIKGITDGDKIYVKLNDTKFNLPTVTVTDKVDGNIEFKIDGNVDIKTEGEYPITYSAKDSLGNETKATIKIIVDGTAPIVTTDYDIKGTTNKNITATIKAEEELQEVEGWKLSEDKKSMTKEYEENISEDITVKDLAGNEAKATITITNIDKEPPTINGVEDGKFYKTVTPVFIEGVATLQKDEEASQTYQSGTQISTDGKYILVVTDAAGNTTTVNFTIDNVAPVFDALEPITLKKGEALPTVIAKDEVNGDIEPEIKITFNRTTVNYIDTTGAKDGKYTITYTAVDEAGNSATPVTRIVTVDATPATLVNLQKSNSNVAKDVIIRVEFNEKMQTLDGWTAENSQKAFTKKYTENVNETIEFKDLAGNTTPVTIKLDNINSLAAAVSYSTLDPTNENVIATITAVEKLQEVEGWTLSEDKLSMTKEYTENTANAEEIKITDLAGNEAIVIVDIKNIDRVAPKGEIVYSEKNPTKENVIATITVDKEIQEVEGWTLSEDKLSMTKEYTENTINAEEVKITDLAGNETTITIEITNIDRVAPKGTVTYSEKNPTKENVIVTIKSDEILQEVEGWKLSEDKLSITKEYTENTIKAESVTITDLAGNTKKVSVSVKNIDKQAPNVTGFIEGVTSYKQVTPVFTDINEPITATLQKGTETSKSFTSGTTISEEGTYKLVVKDSVGNEKTILFDIDNNNVEINNVEEGKVYKTVSPTFTEGAGQLSTLDEENNVISTSIYTSGTPITIDGKYKLTVSDAAGNEASVTFIVDTKGPQFTNIEQNQITNKNVIPTVTSKSAITSIVLIKDGIKDENYTILKQISAEGNYELIVSDEAGNINTIKFTIDKTVKNVKVTYSNNQETTNESVLVTITAEEKIVAPSGWTLTEDGFSMTKSYDANWAGNVVVADIYGNKQTVKIEVKGIDKTIQ